MIPDAHVYYVIQTVHVCICRFSTASW